MTDQNDDVTSLVSALLDAVGVADTGMLVIADRGNGLEQWYANGPCAALFGYTNEEFRDLPVIEAFVPEQREFLLQLCTSFRDGQPVPPALEIGGLHKDGAELDLDIALGHYRIPSGVVYVMVIRDAGTPQRAQLSLLEADRISLVGALASGFAHEINNPLTSVLLNLRSLRKQCGNMPENLRAPAMRCLEDLVTGSDRIADSVRALQMLATRSARQDVDLALVVSSALRLAAPTLESRARVIRHIQPVRPVQGEESRIGQAVLAMIMFSGSGFEDEFDTSSTNKIIVSVEERGNEVVVEVSDNGRDLTTEEVRSAFDPFFRSPARGAGVGVGLGIARSVATTLGGAVTLVPRSGGGAVVTMRLPLA
ncbi:MAG: ATP-binding protein [Kofleriaceae bacterium]